MGIYFKPTVLAVLFFLILTEKIIRYEQEKTNKRLNKRGSPRLKKHFLILGAFLKIL